MSPKDEPVCFRTAVVTMDSVVWSLSVLSRLDLLDALNYILIYETLLFLLVVSPIRTSPDSITSQPLSILE